MAAAAAAGWLRPVKKTLPEKQASQSVGVTVISQAAALLFGGFLEGEGVLLQHCCLKLRFLSHVHLRKSPKKTFQVSGPLKKKKAAM